jgi:hypothetical protein
VRERLLHFREASSLCSVDVKDVSSTSFLHGSAIVTSPLCLLSCLAHQRRHKPMGHGVSTSLSSSASLGHVASVELQLVMEYLDVILLLCLARCSHFTLTVTSCDFAWRKLPPVPFVFDLDPEKVRIQRRVPQVLQRSLSFLRPFMRSVYRWAFRLPQCERLSDRIQKSLLRYCDLEVCWNHGPDPDSSLSEFSVCSESQI